MLEDYKNVEPIVYVQMKNFLKKGLSHAYIFNLNNNVYGEKMVLSFIKNIICDESNENLDLYDRIDNDNYPEIKKIYPDGLWIKKEQLEELQQNFSKKSIESNKRIYIINEAEKLNKSAANSLLKFLEEPSDGIIAILLTNNINLVLETIVSRCQVINFSKNKVEDFINYNNIINNKTLYKLFFIVWGISDVKLIDQTKKEFVDNVISYIKNYENNKEESIISVKKYFLDYFNDKDLIINFFECLILFYRDVIEYKINKEVLYYDDYIKLIIQISDKNTVEKIIQKLKIIVEKEKLIKTNANINLLIDSMIIDMEE